MPKGNLKCHATDCFYNENCECRAGAINVSGQSARSTDETTCTTFVDEAKSSFVNSVEGLSTKTYNIKCQACNCTYNENKGCHAEYVEIDAHNARCNTFKCK